MPVSSGQPKIRVEEASRKEGITFGELAEFVEAARAAGIDDSARIWGDTWVWKHAPTDRSGYAIRFLEV